MNPDAMRVKMAAFAVAMQAKTGSVDTLDVDTLEVQAEELLARGAPLRLAVMEFATQFPLVRDDRAALAAEGARLARAVELAAMAEVPGSGRLDIHG